MLLDITLKGGMGALHGITFLMRETCLKYYEI